MCTGLLVMIFLGCFGKDIDIGIWNIIDSSLCEYTRHMDRSICYFYEGGDWKYEWSGHLLAMTKIESLELHWISTGDPDISKVNLSRIQNLKNLKLYGAVKHHFTNETFADLPRLQSLHILHSEVPSWSAWLWPLANIKELSLSSCKITKFSLEHFCAFPQLEKLSITDCSVTPIDFPSLNVEDLKESNRSLCLPKLNKLDLHGSNIQLLDLKFIRNSDALRSLNASLCHLSELTGMDGRMIMGLESIDLSNNRLSNFTIQDIHGCTSSNLSNLFLQNNQLGNIPRGLFGCTQNLEILNLSGNRFSRNPFEKTILDDLRILDLSHNSLSSFTLRKLDYSHGYKLSKLHLQNNRLTNLSPDLFTYAQHLESLNLSENNLSTNMIKVSGLGQLLRLTNLDLSGNNINSLEAGTFNNSVQLTRFSCQGCRMQSIDKHSLSNLNKLKILDLSHNNLSFTDNRTLSYLTRLIRLDLSYNRLSTFDVGSELPSLVDLILEGNLLQKPPNMTLFPNVRILNLIGNSIGQIDLYSFEGLHNLRYLWMASNNMNSFSSNAGGLDLSLDLSHNNIQHVRFHNHINFVNLSHNSIRRIYLRTPLNKDLMWLDVSFNQISSLPNITREGWYSQSGPNINKPDLMSRLSDHFTFINLTFNNIHYLDEKELIVSQPRQPKPQIYLRGNPLHCDCYNYLLTIADTCM